jgi:NADH-quinone oxidoreductase subunit E
VLSDQEREEIDREIAKFPIRRSACLDALMIIQKHRGYVSDEALVSVSEYLGMSSTELDGIATFYNLIFRKPVGHAVIRLCDSVSCYVLGYESIRNRIKEDLGIDWGETTSDQKFTLLPAQCLGACDRAPVMMIGAELYENLDPDRVRTIVSSYKKEGCDHDTTSHRTDEDRDNTTQFQGI